MDILSRILPYIWPFRRQVALSVMCAVAISLLWAANLSAVMPIVQVLFNEESLHDHVELKIVDLENEIEARKGNIAEIDRTDRERLARAQAKQSEAAQQLVTLQRLRNHVLPWIPRDNFRTVALILLTLVLATFLKGVFIYAQEVLVSNVVNRTIINIRKALFRHTLRLDFQTVSSSGASQLMSHMTNDVEILAVGVRTIL
ncbi:MAG: ABC transporter transmembrane domain-containing protein, partial [Planctomycetaceae bacterium]